MLASERLPPPSLEDVRAETRLAHDGPLGPGEHLMSFEIGETVTVQRHASA